MNYDLNCLAKTNEYVSRFIRYETASEVLNFSTIPLKPL